MFRMPTEHDWFEVARPEDVRVTQWEATAWIETHERVDMGKGSELAQVSQVLVFKYHVPPGDSPHRIATKIVTDKFPEWAVLSVECVLVKNVPHT